MPESTHGGERPPPHHLLLDIGSIDFRTTPLETVLHVAVAANRRIVPGADQVSLTFTGQSPGSVAATGSMARGADAAEYTSGTGPGLDAARSGRSILVADQTTDSRWPGYSPSALQLGVRSSLSIPLRIRDGAAGSITFYALVADAFGPDALGVAEQAVAYTAIALANAQLLLDSWRRVGELSAALEEKIVIEQATGILMSQRHCTADEARRSIDALAEQSGQPRTATALSLIRGTVTAPDGQSDDSG